MRGHARTTFRWRSRALRLAPAAAALALLVAAGPPPHAGRPEAPPGIESRAAKVGSRAPAVALPTASGSRWSLEGALARGPAVLVFYRGDWWPFCQKQLGELQGSEGKFEARGASLVAISVDPPERSKALAEKLGVRFPLLSDGDLKVTRAYGVEDAENGIAWPAIFIVGKDGKIRWRSLAETYKDRPVSAVVLGALEGAK